VAQRVEASKPDVVITGITDSHITALVTALVDAKVGKAYSGTGDDCDYPTTNSLGGAVWVCNYIPINLANPPTAAGKAYAAAFQSYIGQPIDPATDFWSLTEYPYVYALVSAMEAAGTVTDTSQIVAKLHGSSGDHGINYKIAATGLASTDLEIDLIGAKGAVLKQQIYAP
jgi:ABC-type branched-subunit amino acid transport system substrate-binding protein